MDPAHRRSGSPADRGLQTSQQMLKRLKDSHRIALRTQPGMPDASLPPQSVDGTPAYGGASPHHHSPHHHHPGAAPGGWGGGYSSPTPASPPHYHSPAVHSGGAASGMPLGAGGAPNTPPHPAAGYASLSPRALTTVNAGPGSGYVPMRTPTGGGSGANGKSDQRSITPTRRPRTQAPWADIDGENPNQFKHPLPTWTGSIPPPAVPARGGSSPPQHHPHPHHVPQQQQVPSATAAAPQPPVKSPPPAQQQQHLEANANVSPTRDPARFAPPPGREPSTSAPQSPPPIVQEIHHHHYYPPASPGPAEDKERSSRPRVTSVDEYGPSTSDLFFGRPEDDASPPPIPKRGSKKKSRRSTGGDDAAYAWRTEEELPWHVFNLTGNWVSRPTGEEVIQVRHDQARNRIVGSAVKTAVWSDIRKHQVLEGHIIEIDGIPQVELYHKERPVLRLFPELQEDGALLLLPSRGTVGTAGYWEVTPSNANVPRDGNDPTSVTYEARDAYAVDDNEGTVINIYT